MATPEPWWSEFRRQMSVTRRWAYFDHAAVAPLPEPTRAVIRQWADDFAGNGDTNWPAWRERLEETRRLGARLVGADADEIALVHSTTEGIGLVAEGLPWQPGENIVVPAGEFPSNLYPWMNLASRGIEVRQVPTQDERLDLEQLEAACDARTRIVAVSWVGYATGWRNDLDALAAIAHRRAALLLVDAIQGLGVFPLDVTRTPIDFLAADGHKWLLGPEGAGLLYIRREHLARLRPLMVGWNSVKQAGQYTDARLELKETAARYEGGTFNMMGHAALGASLRLLLDCGIDTLAARVLEITDRLCARLVACGAEIASCRDDERRSGIVAFTWPGETPLAVKRRLAEHGVAVTCRAGRVRVSPHAYTSDVDIERLIGALTMK